MNLYEFCVMFQLVLIKNASNLNMYPCQLNLLLCVLFYFSFIRLNVCAVAIYSMVHCESTFEPDSSGLPHYCTSTCARSGCTWRASCVDSNPLPPKKMGVVVEKLSDVGPHCAESVGQAPPGGMWIGCWFSSQLYYPFSKGLGQH